MANAKDFSDFAQQAVAAGKPLVVEVLKKVDELGQENVLDPGMRGVVIGVLTDYGYGDEPMYRVKIDLTDYMEFNAPYERADWFVDADAMVTGRARGTNNWPEGNIDELWFMPKQNPNEYLKLACIEGYYLEYRDSGFDGTYIEYLEWNLKVARSRNKGET